MIYCDSQSTVAMTRNPVMHGRTKHIEIKHHYIRHLVAAGVIWVEFCPTEEQLADMFTKALPPACFQHLRACIGIGSFESKWGVED